MNDHGQIIPSEHWNDARFRQLFDALPVAAYACESSGAITHFNARAARLWGRSPKLNDPADRFCGSHLTFLPDGSPLPHAQCWMAKALATGREFNGEEMIVERPDGERVATRSHASPVRNSSGEVIGGVNVLIEVPVLRSLSISALFGPNVGSVDKTQSPLADPSHIQGSPPSTESTLIDLCARQAVDSIEIIRLCSELHEAGQRNDQFLAILSHELRNPLAPLSNAVQILKLQDDLSPPVAELCGLMERQIDHLVRLVDDLLDVSRLTHGRVRLATERVELSGAKNGIDGDGSRRAIETFARIPTLVVTDADRRRPASRWVPPNLSRWDILVVDDSRAAATMLSRLLESLGQRVRTVNDGFAALEAVRQERPEIVISDIAMPRLDGYALAGLLRREPGMENARLVALTGFGQDSDRQRARSAGFDHHLVKPVSLESLLELLTAPRPAASDANLATSKS